MISMIGNNGLIFNAHHPTHHLLQDLLQEQHVRPLLSRQGEPFGCLALGFWGQHWLERQVVLARWSWVRCRFALAYHAAPSGGEWCANLPSLTTILHKTLVYLRRRASRTRTLDTGADCFHNGSYGSGRERFLPPTGPFSRLNLTRFSRP